MKNENVIQIKSYELAIEIVHFCRKMQNEKEYVLSKQLIRSGTAVGALVEEAIGGQSSRDFVYKITIAYKEARETKYWLRLIADTYKIEPELTTTLLQKVEELLKILGSIQKTMKAKTTT